MDPERAICPAYDSTGIRKDLTPSREKMGVRVVDNACEEHMMYPCPHRNRGGRQFCRPLLREEKGRLFPFSVPGY